MTGIRGVAAMWVLLLHARQDAGRYFGLSSLENIPGLSSGWHGVDLFFMLSGFILMYAHERDFKVIRKENLVRFARLRFTRVYPLNAVVLCLIGLMVLSAPDYVAWSRSFYGPSMYSAGAFFSTLFLATRWFLPVHGEFNQPVWSLSLEALGYMAFPFLALYAQRIRRKWQLAAIASISLVFSFLVLRQFAAQWENSQIAVTRMGACFITGIVIYRLWALRAAEAPKSWWRRPIAELSAFGIVLSALGVFNGGQPFHGDFQMNFLFATLLYGLAFQQGIVHRVLSSRVALFLGEISFPLYLLHVAPLLWLRYYMLSHGAEYTPLEKYGALFAWAAGCILLATLLHAFVEKPFHSWGRRWAGARAPHLERPEVKVRQQAPSRGSAPAEEWELAASSTTQDPAA